MVSVSVHVHYWCPNCHKEVNVPQIVYTTIVKGLIPVPCNHCNDKYKGNPRGIVQVRGRQN